jgi:Skp family chaperone for outer membrane proteins
MVQRAPAFETSLPPNFDRFIEERDRRLTAELGRLETLIQNNARRIEDLHAEIDRRFAEAKAEREVGFAEARAEREAGFAEAKADRQAIREDMNRRFAEAREERAELRREIARLDTKIDSHFRWTMGLLVPMVVGMLAIVVRLFLMGLGP